MIIEVQNASQKLATRNSVSRYSRGASRHGSSKQATAGLPRGYGRLAHSKPSRPSAASNIILELVSIAFAAFVLSRVMILILELV